MWWSDLHSFSRLRLLKLCLPHRYLLVIRFGFIFCPVLSKEIAIVLYIIISVGQFFQNHTLCKHFGLASIYTVLQKFAHIGLNQNLFRPTTLDIITKLLDNAAFVFMWWEDFQKISGKCVG